MALPMLVGGASDCGPINPLQVLTKTFEQDRAQQDQFIGSSSAGPSKHAFRSQQISSRPVDNDIARFFSPPRRPATATAFDLSSLDGSLPATDGDSGMRPMMQTHHPVPADPWTGDFLQNLAAHGTTVPKGPRFSAISQQGAVGTSFHSPTQDGAFFIPRHHALHQRGFPYNFSPSSGLAVPPDPALWDQDFVRMTDKLLVPLEEQTVNPRSAEYSHDNVAEADALSRTAGFLMEVLRDEQNPKFRNSEFMGLMRSLRDKTLVVEGNEIVARESVLSESASQRQLSGSSVDVKGKGKALANTLGMTGVESLRSSRITENDSDPFQQSSHRHAGLTLPPEHAASSSSLDEYFRQENEDYIKYQYERYNNSPQVIGSWDADTAEWDKLQRDWNSFEATATGIRPIANYQFTPNNPYLLGERHTGITLDTIHHHANEGVLKLEAAVQRDPTNAHAWFALGLRQQDNEREAKAMEALRRAVELDPEFTPTWLALGISYSNESDRLGAYSAIREWVVRHKGYGAQSQKLKSSSAEDAITFLTPNERLNELIDCLIAMARNDVDGTVDADIQVALAVLLNCIEEYSKATDCFLTALAVRPDDWVLYNRVGATLANSGRAIEALEYYNRALELNPGYIRARFNMGISCTNLHRYEEAGRHILDALTLQDSDTVGDKRGGVTSGVLWNCLRTACVHLNRMDLAEMCHSEDLEGIRARFPS